MQEDKEYEIENEANDRKRKMEMPSGVKIG